MASAVRSPLASLFAASALVVVACGPRAPAPPPPRPAATGCPDEMARVDAATPGGRDFCIDRYEASLVEVGADGSERAFSPFDQVTGHTVRAVSREGVVPQAYISRNEAAAACRRSSKRLCTEAEWVHACSGPHRSTYPYGSQQEAGACNDRGKAPLVQLAGVLAADEWSRMNDPRLNQVPGSLAKTGSHPACKSAFGVFDMVGNVHEWVDDPDGTFLGGYYLDTKLNGPGCRYKTVAHAASYHDYSTGFRCCADAK